MRKVKYNPDSRLYLPFNYSDEKYRIRVYSKCRTDQTFAASNKSLMEQFLATGKLLASRQALQYDFPDGKDDGKPLDITRLNTFGAEAPEISSAMANEQDRLESVQQSRVSYAKQKAANAQELKTVVKEITNPNE